MLTRTFKLPVGAGGGPGLCLSSELASRLTWLIDRILRALVENALSRDYARFYASIPRAERP